MLKYKITTQHAPTSMDETEESYSPDNKTTRQ
jgi:hypothetical protein